MPLRSKFLFFETFFSVLASRLGLSWPVTGEFCEAAHLSELPLSEGNFTVEWFSGGACACSDSSAATVLMADTSTSDCGDRDARSDEILLEIRSLSIVTVSDGAEGMFYKPICSSLSFKSVLCCLYSSRRTTLQSFQLQLPLTKGVEFHVIVLYYYFVLSISIDYVFGVFHMFGPFIWASRLSVGLL